MAAKGTRKKNVRLDDVLWAQFGQATASAGFDRSFVIRSFMEWYVGRPGAELPQRPPTPD